MLELFRLLVIGGFLTLVTFLVLLALPQCRLREIVMPFVSWAFVALCAAYTLSPVDILPEAVLGPFGLFDDLGAVVLGVSTAMSTIRAQKQKKAGYHDPTLN